MSDPRPSLPNLVRRLDVRPAEIVALALLAAGAAAVVALLWWLNRPADLAEGAATPQIDATATADPGGLALSSGEVIVHVAGAVQEPGVYTLPGGSRVGEAVTAAGGPTRRAVLDGLNLARVVVDGEQVLVPDKRSQAAPAGAGGAVAAPGTGAAQAATVSLNQAAVTDLETLPGIGPVLAQRIIDHRDSIGGFTEIGELRDVPGIGEKTFQALADLVTV